MLRKAARWAILAASFLCIASVSCQDNGQKAAELKPLINGTLPNGQRFRAASTSVDTAAYLGVLSTGPLVSPPFLTTWSEKYAVALDMQLYVLRC